MQRKHHIRRRDRLALTHLGDRTGIQQHFLQKSTQTHAHLLVNPRRNALDAAAAREAPDRGFGDTRDVVAEDFAVE